MKKNLYFRTVIRRENNFKNLIFAVFSGFASYARLLLEVFIRKDFGERYFKLSAAVTIAAILAVWPVIPKSISAFTSFNTSSLMSEYLTWYIFLAAFIIVSVRHRIAIKKSPSVYDFAKYSLYSGKINPFFFTINLPDKKTDDRRIETFLEPVLFLILGVILSLAGQKLGSLLITCSVIYAVSYMQAYDAGDDFVMDKIDEIISLEELNKSFGEGASREDTRGFTMRMRRPEDADMRRKIMPLMTENEEIIRAK